MLKQSKVSKGFTQSFLAIAITSLLYAEVLKGSQFERTRKALFFCNPCMFIFKIGVFLRFCVFEYVLKKQ